ncbi:unnamed protein product [Brassica oleracea]
MCLSVCVHTSSIETRDEEEEDTESPPLKNPNLP